jgi:aarF domain-containing kinase
MVRPRPRRSSLVGEASGANLLAPLQQGARRLAELDQIPRLVRDIWGRHSEALVGELRQQRHAARALIRRWEDAEHRLIAVANSLATLQAGQKLMAVGVPLAASQLLRRDASPALCFHAAMPGRGPHPAAAASLELQLGGGPVHAALARLAAAVAAEAALALRAAYLFFLFLPAALTWPAAALSGARRDDWLRLLRWTLERAGPAFIKWGQWSATRPDLFPADLCAELASLQTKAPSHAFPHTRAAVEEAFGCKLDHLFDEFDAAPVASGSIAQVHRAVLSPAGAAAAQRGAAPAGGLLPLRRRRAAAAAAAAFAPGAPVAVKVRHPGVSTVLEQDVVLMQRAAAVAARVPGLGGPQVLESVMQFGAPLREQLDLTAEAAALSRFAANFRWWRGVRFPRPAAPPLVAPGVLVETFEEGEHISAYVAAPDGRHSKTLAGLGLGCYLKMLLRDNFIHADLHPGNILVAMDAPAPGSWAAALGARLGLDLRVPRLVLLDVGMTAALSGDDQAHLLSFFGGLARMDGPAVADAMVRFSHAALHDPAAFKADVAAIFADLDPDHLRAHTQEVMASMMEAVRQHGVHLRGAVTTVIVTSMVLEGWSTKLDPDLRILEMVRGLLPAARRERVGRTAERLATGHALAMA